jgi:O-antigen/teichoic acid export membrane protein
MTPPDPPPGASAAETEPVPAEGAAHHVRAVARGGALNLFGSVVYGVANFAFLVVLTNQLGAARAGAALVAIALFTIMSRLAELGASTGLIRTISRDRALRRIERIAPTLYAALAPVLVVGVLFAVALYVFAAPLARLFGGGEDTTMITNLLRVLAPFLPISAAYTVLVQGSRGFDVMWLLVWVEKIVKSCLLPLAAWIVIRAGGDATGAVAAWAAVTALAAVLTVFLFLRLVRAELAAHGGHEELPAAPFTDVARGFWVFTLPRAFGQAFNVAVLWFDTLLVSAMIGATAGGIYAAGTRYLLVGTFTLEAIMQAVGPKVSGLLTLKRVREAHTVVAQSTAWQAAIIWPAYLVIGSFAATLLGVFGPEYVRAETALVLLAGGMLVASLCGPCDSVILMSGRSRQSLFNSAAELGINVAGNLILVPIYGISAAGGVWAVTLVVAAGLPAFQATRKLGVVPFSRELARTVGVAVGTVGVACLAGRLLFGDSWAGLLVALGVGGTSYCALTWRLRRSIHFQALLDSFRRDGPGVVSPAPQPT